MGANSEVTGRDLDRVLRLVTDRYDDDSDAAPFWAHYWDALACSFPDRSGITRSITTSSDFYSDREYCETPMYREYIQQSGFVREMMLCLRIGPGRTHRVLLCRGPGSDFTERERAPMILLRPHIATAYRDAARRRERAPRLTVRQWELLRLVAAGNTDTQIARRMSVS